MIQFTGRYAWLILIGATLIEYMIGRHRILAGTVADDALRRRALRVFGCLSLLTGLAWLVIGLSIMLGGVPSPFSYMHPEDHNPYVTAWFIGMLILAVAFTLWVLLADVASRMRELQRLGAFGRASQFVEMPEWLIKLLALLVPAFVLLFIYAAEQAGTRIPG